MTRSWQVIRQRDDLPMIESAEWWRSRGSVLALMDRTTLNEPSLVLEHIHRIAWNMSVNSIKPFNVSVFSLTAPYGR